jgi:hypothetical protein
MWPLVERDVERFALLLRAQIRQFANEVDDALAEQRLAAGQPNLRDSHADKNARHAQVVVEGKVAVERAFVPRAAVHTLVVAAVRNGDPEVSDGTAEFVVKSSHERFAASI